MIIMSVDLGKARTGIAVSERGYKRILNRKTG